MAQLLTGIANDAKDLLRQELALAKYEIHEELRKTKTAMLSLGIGIGVASIGGLLLILMLVHLLNTLAGLPLWICYGIIGGLFLAIGGVLLLIGKSTTASIDVVPPQTVETMKENVRWIKDRTTPDGKTHMPQ